jgi:RNA polymerase sigma-70 factor (ECF subfamily)
MTGNHPTFDQIYERHHRSIVAYCLRRTSPEDAYAAANEVFEVAWKRSSEMPAGERTLPWLYGVARRVLFHQRRSATRFSRLTSKAARQPALHQPQPDHVVVQRLEYEMVCSAVNRLPADDKEMLLLSAWEGLTHAEIAETMGHTLTTVDKRLARAKQRLKRQYEAVYADNMHRPPASTTKGGEA